MRKKRNPLNEGSLREIFDLFIKPLVNKYGYRKMNEIVFMEWLFDVENRQITRWKVKKPFTIPGLLYVAGAVKVQGIGYRELKPDTILWVRSDRRNPDLIDVEFQGGQGGAEQVFGLTASEWKKIQHNLIVVDKQ